MSVKVIMRTAMIAALTFSCGAAMAQTPAPSPRRPPRVGARVTRRSAPQVVTIVHRLNGLKMFRLLLRSEQPVQAIAGLDSAFNLMDDVHTNVIAGLALDDGETIAVWMPEAEVEFGPWAIAAPKFPSPKLPTPPKAPALAGAFPELNGSFYNTPDVTVIGPDGKQLRAKYIGFDATTGLCIFQLAEKKLLPPAAIKDEPVGVGENVLLFGPEPAPKMQSLLGNNLYVRMGAIEGRIEDVQPAPSGEVARLKISSPRLSQAKVGGVALNEAGETIGIVDGLDGNEASILPAASIRRAAQRVLAWQASVPRPWLGVQGEAVAALKLDQMLNHGWTMDRAADLAGKHRGIFLTSVAPGSPAELAALRAGDVILKVDDKEIQKEEDFTWWLDQAGPSRSVRFTVARPDRPVEEALNVKLSGMLDPKLGFRTRNRYSPQRSFLIEQGIETIALRPLGAAQLGTTAGLLVVYVEPSTPAFAAGLQPGDVIQLINGKAVSALNRSVSLKLPLALEVVRQKQKLAVTLTQPAKK